MNDEQLERWAEIIYKACSFRRLGYDEDSENSSVDAMRSFIASYEAAK